MVDAVPANGQQPAAGSGSPTILAQINGMYDGDPAHQAMLARYASAKLGPLLRRLGWSAAAGRARPMTRSCAAS